jgi:mono/diheme cytochrome c family protein
MTRKARGAVLFLAALGMTALLVHCAGDGSGLIDDMEPPALEPTLTAIQSEVFGAICIECHVPGGPGPMPLDSATASYENLVGVPSVEIQGLLRVTAGSAESSYLVHKIEGRSSIVGDRMPPPPRPSLAPEQILAIREWIDDGALPAPIEPTLASIQANVFGVICVACHVPGGPGPMPLDSAAASYQNLVGVPSVEIQGLLRVAPGSAEFSYLVHKIEGRPSIVGQRMPPPPRPSLTAEQIAAIREWIDDGALP